jgi:hypothetical protein
MKGLALIALAVSALASDIPKIKFTDTTLDNGLRVIISEYHYAPSMRSASATKSDRRTNTRGVPVSPTCSGT